MWLVKAHKGGLRCVIDAIAWTYLVGLAAIHMSCTTSLRASDSG